MEKLLIWIISSDQSPSILKHKEFAEFIDFMRPNTAKQSNQILLKQLDEMYLKKKNDLKRELKSLKFKYSISCYVSSDPFQFFAFTMHYIDDQWNHHEKLLHFKEYDYNSLNDALLQVLLDFEILPGFLSVTMGNSTDYDTFELEDQENCPPSAFSVKWNQVECISTVMNYAASDILRRFETPFDSETYRPPSNSKDRMLNAVSRLSFLTRRIKSTPELWDLMEKLCKETNVEFIIPILDFDENRWTTNFDILVRALSMKNIIEATIHGSRDMTFIELVLDEDDWKSIEKLIKLLEPLKEITLIITQANSRLFIAEVLPIYDYCITTLTESMQQLNDNEDVKMDVQAALRKVQCFYEKISPFVGIAAILNPALKQNYFSQFLGWKQERIDTVMEQFINSFKHYKQIVAAKLNEPQSALQVKSNEGYNCGYMRFLERKREQFTLEEEYLSYFNAPLAAVGTNIFEYWKKNQVNYPVLSAMAKDYLTVQVTSLPAERVVSSGIDLVTADESRLLESTIEKTHFIKFHLKKK